MSTNPELDRWFRALSDESCAEMRRSLLLTMGALNAFWDQYEAEKAAGEPTDPEWKLHPEC